MKASICLNELLLLAAVAYFAAPPPAHAYLDPGTGSYMTQVLFSFAFAGWIFIKSLLFKRG